MLQGYFPYKNNGMNLLRRKIVTDNINFKIMIIATKCVRVLGGCNVRGNPSQTKKVITHRVAAT
jgi:hypothetical protein